eukprot:TRINITY_DN43040_c0_g1_i1.p1 TRINITY_DN43040_c0_g1~~TRINITY_DN43040_c0_g1_i1.p1  ORF type:complete len:746 (+),score=119.07 TRINITY_DN43040_c0_g1_i1:109-2238(+)
MSTCGWNACLCGRKRWCLLAPDTDIVSLGLHLSPEGPACWFLDHLSRLQTLAAEGKVSMFECIQEPHDLVFIPHGWHHAIVNLEFSIALGQTVMAPAALQTVWPQLRKEHPGISMVLRDVLQVALPDLAKELSTALSPSTVQAGLRRPTPTANRLDSRTDSRQVKLPLHWHRVDDITDDRSCDMAAGYPEDGFNISVSSGLVVFLYSSWLTALIKQRPTVSHVLSRGKPAIEDLMAYHEQIHALASLLDEDASSLYLVSSSCDEMSDYTAEKAALVEHGLLVRAVVSANAAARGVHTRGAKWMAILQGDAARIQRMQQAVVSIPSLCNVKVQDGVNKGAGLHTGSSCRPGDILLSVPLDVCVFAGSPDPRLAGGNVFSADDPLALLRLAFVKLLTEQPGDQRVAYFESACPPDYFTTHIAFWKDSSTAARIARQSLAWQRVQGLRSKLELERLALAELGIQVEADRYAWAALVVQTRALQVASSVVLCPVLDLCNHASVGSTVRVEIAAESVSLVSLYALGEGCELSTCYDNDADYLDLFERFSFFDSFSVLHTAEVVVPLKDLLESTVNSWQYELIVHFSNVGYDEHFLSWWVPDFGVDASPLFAATRCIFVSEQELGIDAGTPTLSADEMAQIVKQPIKREAAAWEKFSSFLTEHLAGYDKLEVSWAMHPSTLEPSVLSWSPAEDAALRLVSFEQELLSAHLKRCKV